MKYKTIIGDKTIEQEQNALSCISLKFKFILLFLNDSILIK